MFQEQAQASKDFALVLASVIAFSLVKHLLFCVRTNFC